MAVVIIPALILAGNRDLCSRCGKDSILPSPSLGEHSSEYLGGWYFLRTQSNRFHLPRSFPAYSWLVPGACCLLTFLESSLCRNCCLQAMSLPSPSPPVSQPPGTPLSLLPARSRTWWALTRLLTSLTSLLLRLEDRIKAFLSHWKWLDFGRN